jgi:hypothetical protein
MELGAITSDVKLLVHRDLDDTLRLPTRRRLK